MHSIETWEVLLEAALRAEPAGDAGHDVGHIRRVRANALRLARDTSARHAVLLPAVWLHDCVPIAKSSPERSRASALSATRARSILAEIEYPFGDYDDIAHAIEAHSFSGGVPPRTLEARILRDADRLDALGAIGLARCLAVGAQSGRLLYAEQDPFCLHRAPDDRRHTLDHFYVKLLHLADDMLTDAGRSEALRRTEFLRAYLAQLATEI